MTCPAKILAWDLAALNLSTIWRENELACMSWIGLANYLVSNQPAQKQQGRAHISVKQALSGIDTSGEEIVARQEKEIAPSSP
jgi:hypothetical protein